MTPGRPTTAVRGVALLALLLVGLSSRPGPAAASSQRVPSLEPAVVVDSAGAVIGPLLGAFQGLGMVLVRAGGRVVTLLAGRDQLASFEPAVFETTSCAGPAFIEAPPAGSLPHSVDRGAVGPLGEVLAPTGDPELRAIKSRLQALEGLGCQALLGSTDLVRPTVILPVGPYLPPLRVEVGPVAPGTGPSESAEHADRVGSSHPVVALDAAGRLVGHVLGAPGSDAATVWLRVGPQSFVGTIRPDGSVRSQPQRQVGLVVFEAADCSGPPLIYDVTLATYSVTPLFEPAGPGPDGRLLGAAGPEDFKTILAQWDEPQPGCNALAAATVMVVAPTRTVLDPVDLALPLRLR